MAATVIKPAALLPLSPFPELLLSTSTSTSTAIITPNFTRFSHFTVAKKRPTRQILPVVKAQGSLEYVPDSKFYKVEAILRPWRIQNVSSALLKMGIRGVTVSDVRGFGSQGGSTERQGGSEFSEDNFVAKVKMEVVVIKDQVEAVIDKIIEEARTGEIGDGKIFVTPVADVIRVRTGERGEKAERMTGGRYDMSVNEV
ncbi:nitrogen regulatory protein P-II homolog [Momordica charantia]|uniref:Nitrogen regulatory protein P-II homolog n=1 Tax=Momordica charantia TaxID=3673 RepID=A0A6J1DC20_MOMCH|nr:nitrogen regulatory protein P-II homolog [Momordica charantia]